MLIRYVNMRYEQNRFLLEESQSHQRDTFAFPCFVPEACASSLELYGEWG